MMTLEAEPPICADVFASDESPNKRPVVAELLYPNKFTGIGRILDAQRKLLHSSSLGCEAQQEASQIFQTSDLSNAAYRSVEADAAQGMSEIKITLASLSNSDRNSEFEDQPLAQALDAFESLQAKFIMQVKAAAQAGFAVSNIPNSERQEQLNNWVSLLIQRRETGREVAGAIIKTFQERAFSQLKGDIDRLDDQNKRPSEETAGVARYAAEQNRIRERLTIALQGHDELGVLLRDSCIGESAELFESSALQVAGQMRYELLRKGEGRYLRISRSDNTSDTSRASMITVHLDRPEHEFLSAEQATEVLNKLISSFSKTSAIEAGGKVSSQHFINGLLKLGTIVERRNLTLSALNFIGANLGNCIEQNVTYDSCDLTAAKFDGAHISQLKVRGTTGVAGLDFAKAVVDRDSLSQLQLLRDLQKNSQTAQPSVGWWANLKASVRAFFRGTLVAQSSLSLLSSATREHWTARIKNSALLDEHLKKMSPRTARSSLTFEFERGTASLSFAADGKARVEVQQWLDGRLQDIVSAEYSGDVDSCVEYVSGILRLNKRLKRDNFPNPLAFRHLYFEWCDSIVKSALTPAAP